MISIVKGISLPFLTIWMHQMSFFAGSTHKKWTKPVENVGFDDFVQMHTLMLCSKLITTIYYNHKNIITATILYL